MRQIGGGRRDARVDVGPRRRRTLLIPATIRGMRQSLICETPS